jgi:hypothetical protein
MDLAFRHCGGLGGSTARLLVCARLVTDWRTPLNILGEWSRWNLKITRYGKMGHSIADSIGNTEGWGKKKTGGRSFISLQEWHSRCQLMMR